MKIDLYGKSQRKKQMVDGIADSIVLNSVLKKRLMSLE